MRVFLQELKMAWRSLFARSAFSALVITVLTAGLACVMFMLVVLDAMVFRPLPFADAERIYHIGYARPDGRNGSDPLLGPDAIRLQRHLDGLGTVAAWTEATINLSDAGKPERFSGALVTHNLWTMLGIQPQLGRDFRSTDDQPGAPATVMLSHALWLGRYGGDAKIVGRTIRVNTQVAEVIGVMPPNVSFPRKEFVWLSSRFSETADDNAGFSYQVGIHLNPGVNAAALSTALDTWLAESQHRDIDKYRNIHIASNPLAYSFIDYDTRSLLGTMFAAVMLVLLVACANAANLLLTRTLSRRQELAVRMALGASRGRLAMHLLAQSLMLSTIAAILALPLAMLGVEWIDHAFRGAVNDGPPLWISFALDGKIVLLSVGCALFAALLTGLLPALRIGAGGLTDSLRDGNRAVAGGGFARISRVLVVGEIALSCVLLVASGTMVRGIQTMVNADLGIDTSQVLTARVALFPTSFPTGADQVRWFERLTERLRQESDVVDASAATTLPGLIADQCGVRRETDSSEAAAPRSSLGAVDDRFFSAYKVNLSSGRLFDSRDRADSEPVAVVDARFQQRYGDGTSVLGRRFRIENDDGKRVVTVVGIVPTLHLTHVTEGVTSSLMVPIRQQPSRYVSVAVRVKGQPQAFATRLSTIVRNLDADTPVYWVRTYAEVIREATFGDRILTELFGVFGLIALVLAAAGLYGVIAFTVGQRTREIGVRRALGAPTARLLRGLLARSVRQVAIGLTLGLILGVPFAAALVAHLRTDRSGDPLVLIGVSVTLAIVAFLAALVPARRALRVDPMVALRYE